MRFGERPMTSDSSWPDLLKATLAGAVQDVATVRSDGNSLQNITHGVTIRRLVTHVDQRGSVVELYDTRWGFSSEALPSAYCFTIRPGVVKGWNLHESHEDRYALLEGDMELVLFDPRADSPTHGHVCRIRLSSMDRCLVNVPMNVWHADINIGCKDVVVINFPTKAYDHAAPDKWRLPIDTPLIPYRFPAGVVSG